MKELQKQNSEHHEIDPQKNLNIMVIGPACSGKSTLLRSLANRGSIVHPEPENSVFPIFLENPKKFAFNNQLNLATRLMEVEMHTMAAPQTGTPQYRESGVLATDIYNRYLHDQGYLSDDQFNHLNWLYQNHLNTFPTPDLVIYLSADEQRLKDRAILRDGAVAMNPTELQPYWDRLLGEIEDRGISLLRINTGQNPTELTTRIVQNEVVKLTKERNMPPIRRANKNQLFFRSATSPI